MCGIYGFSGKKPDINKIIALGLQNMTRGVDSAGIYFEYSDKEEEKYFHKCKAERADVLLKEIIQSKLIDHKTTLVIAHNRAKSIGAVSINNTHPFLIDDGKGKKIVLCHNGTIKTHNTLINKYDKLTYKEIDVDSQVFAYYFSRYDNIEILKRYTGGAALVWKDVNTNVLKVFRDKERPLHYGFINNSLYYSSEEIALEIIGCKDIKQFEENIIYDIVDGQIVNQSEKIVHEPFPVSTYNHTPSSNNVCLPAVIKPENKKLTKSEIKQTLNRIRNKKNCLIADFDQYFNESCVVITKKNRLMVTNKHGIDINIDLNTFYKTDISQEGKLIDGYHQNLNCFLRSYKSKNESIFMTYCIEKIITENLSEEKSFLGNFTNSRINIIEEQDDDDSGNNSEFNSASETCNYCYGVGCEKCNDGFVERFSKINSQLIEDDDEDDYDVNNLNIILMNTLTDTKKFIAKLLSDYKEVLDDDTIKTAKDLENNIDTIIYKHEVS